MPSPATDGHLAVRDIELSFPGGFRLRAPGLDFPPRSATVCIGPSGCGKSTLLQLLAGILLPARGEVVLDGTSWAAQTDRDRRARRLSRVGQVFQEFELLDYLTVRDNILLPYLVQPAAARDDRVGQRVRALAQASGIEELLPRHPRALSQGERQRVALCRALVTLPAVVLADEPTGNLDPVTSAAVLDLMLAQTRERGATTIVVTHDHSALPRFGRVIEFTTATDGYSEAHLQAH